VGKESATSQWIEWEIERAIQGSKRLIGVKISKDYVTPSALYNQGAKWALSFNFDAIKKAIDSA
jgi:Thoeris protein ThsB, TIR-like domain